MGEERTQAEFLGLAEGTASAVVELERAVERFGLAQRQQALGLALWRTTSGHPSFRMTADFIIDQLVMRDGGRDIRVEVRVFPPEGAPYRELGHRQGYGLDELGRPRFVEPKVTWRGSYSDFATDLLELLGPDGVERLCDEALPRARFVRDERGEKT